MNSKVSLILFSTSQKLSLCNYQITLSLFDTDKKQESLKLPCPANFLYLTGLCLPPKGQPDQSLCRPTTPSAVFVRRATGGKRQTL